MRGCQAGAVIKETSMHSLQFYHSSGRPIIAQDPGIAIGIAQTWLALGSLALLCFSQLRGSSVWIGWLPFWLVVAPLADLLILRWRSLLGLSRTTFANLQRRRPALRHAVSRRAKKARVPRRHSAQGQLGSTLTALLTDH
jgi:hypothetical protein